MFETDKLSASLVFGQYPRMLGFSPDQTIDLKVKVTILRQYGVAEVLDMRTRNAVTFNQSDIQKQTDGWRTVSGCDCGEVSYSELETQRFVHEDTVLIRFEISVV